MSKPENARGLDAALKLYRSLSPAAREELMRRLRDRCKRENRGQ